MTELLIVPYGIETVLKYTASKVIILLIVPYGIETSSSSLSTVWQSTLLIVPYGIETLLLLVFLFLVLSF